MIFIIIIAAIILVVVFGYFGWLAAKKRRDALSQLARKLGWSFSPASDRSHDEEYAHFEIFRRGHSRAAYNTLWGTLEIHGATCAAKAGDFTYKVTSSNGKTTTTTTYHFSYLILHLPYPRVPDLIIRPEGFFDKFAGAIGFDDIDFESVDFSRKFFVKSPDKRHAYDVIHARMMEFLLETRPVCVDMEHGRCCMSDGAKRWEPQQFEDTIDWLRRFFDLWPEHVVRDLAVRS